MIFERSSFQSINKSLKSFTIFLRIHFGYYDNLYAIEFPNGVIISFERGASNSKQNKNIRDRIRRSKVWAKTLGLSTKT